MAVAKVTGINQCFELDRPLEVIVLRMGASLRRFLSIHATSIRRASRISENQWVLQVQMTRVIEHLSVLKTSPVERIQWSTQSNTSKLRAGRAAHSLRRFTRISNINRIRHDFNGISLVSFREDEGHIAEE